MACDALWSALTEVALPTVGEGIGLQGGGWGGLVLRRDPDGYYFVKRVAAGGGGGLEVGDSVREIDRATVFRKTQAQVEVMLAEGGGEDLRVGVWDGDGGVMKEVVVSRAWAVSGV